MPEIQHYATQFQALLAKYQTITILSHVNPDADAIGTALGIYDCLKQQGYRVEVVNASADIPRHLDFLPHFGKIKQKIDFEDSLIVSCDCGSIDRLGFALEERAIVNIDHHATNQQFGVLNIVNASAVSSSEVAFKLLKACYPISKGCATAFYAALISDTRNFTTSNMSQDTFYLAAELVDIGVDIVDVTQKMMHRRSLASLRILGVAIDSLELRAEGKIAILKISQEDLQKTGAKMSDLDGVVDYAKSLVTVEVALMFVARKKDTKVSLRSKGLDVSTIAETFGGGGHRLASGFEQKNSGDLIEKVVEKILEGGIVA